AHELLGRLIETEHLVFGSRQVEMPDPWHRGTDRPTRAASSRKEGRHSLLQTWRTKQERRTEEQTAEAVPSPCSVRPSSMLLHPLCEDGIKRERLYERMQDGSKDQLDQPRQDNLGDQHAEQRVDDAAGRRPADALGPAAGAHAVPAPRQADEVTVHHRLED